MKRAILFATFLLICCAPFASAQSRGSYFFENSLMRSKLNPAFAPMTTYISVPVIGSLGVDVASNVGLGNFIFPARGKSYSFLNDNISSDTFLSKLPRRDPYVQERIESDLLGAGMSVGDKGYATVSLSVVESGRAVIPGDLLRFAKVGESGGYDAFDNLGLNMAGYLSLGAGFSYDLSDFVTGLRAGARVKLLVGIAAANFQMQQLDLEINRERVAVNALGSGALSGINYADDKFSFGGIGLRGIGAAIDLGASYWLPLEGFFDGIEFSASVCDLGAISFNRRLTNLSYNDSFSFTGISDLSGNLNEELQRLMNELQGLTQFETSEGKAFGYKLSPSIHVGAMAPFYHDMFNVGLLYYHTVGHSNLMAAFNASPFDWLNLGINWTFIGPASRFGFYAEYIPRKYVGFFFGMERASWRHNSDHLAIGNFTDSFSLGLNVLFGDYSFWR